MRVDCQQLLDISDQHNIEMKEVLYSEKTTCQSWLSLTLGPKSESKKRLTRGPESITDTLPGALKSDVVLGSPHCSDLLQEPIKRCQDLDDCLNSLWRTAEPCQEASCPEP